MTFPNSKRISAVVIIVAIVGIAWVALNRLTDDGNAAPRRDGPAAAVEAAPITHGPIALRRTFSGALEATAAFRVAPKVGGTVERLEVDLSDDVAPGQVVARLDDDEYVQAVNAAEADLAVARATLAEAKSGLEIATRSLRRSEALRKQRVISASEFDTAKAEHLAKAARLEVAQAQISRAEAALQSARIRLGYTQVTADWTGGDDHRVVAERFVDEGQTVTANDPLLTIVEIDPITGVFFVTERDYGRLEEGQSVDLATDAYPGETFQGRITRIAPVFKETTRQARVELTVENAEGRLKPGMFIRATVILDRVADAVLVPEAALAKRNDERGVFLLADDGRSVQWRPVTPGIREGGRVQILGDDLSGRVVTLGQQLVDDGSPVVLPGDAETAQP